ncbi:hypothetical protein GGR51DRAFT_572324 [Nemania sp. FL0031]|nr:hypothetical protein GGR51DRAFT_572324 [Nemania sp. FL0031]
MPSNQEQMEIVHYPDTSHYTKLYLSIYIFAGNPDTWDSRHVLAYFQSAEDPNFHETVHARSIHSGPLQVAQVHVKRDWWLSSNYIHHCDGGALLVPRGEEMAPVNIMAAVSVKRREKDFNCQKFLLEGLQRIVAAGYQTEEWYIEVEGALMDLLLDGAQSG